MGRRPWLPDLVESGSTWTAMLNLDHISGFAEVATSNIYKCLWECQAQPPAYPSSPVAHIPRRELRQPLCKTVLTTPESRGQGCLVLAGPRISKEG